VAGECQTGEPLQCDDEKACTDDACDPTAGCVYTNDDSNSCVDDDACNGQETCSGGSCLAGTEPTCDDHEPCTDDSCDPVDGCVFTANDTNACSDENVCTVGDACHNGVCVSGAEPDCSTVGEECQTASCDPTGDEGNCDQLKPAADGTECDDGDACNVGESCQDGECSGGEPQSCPVRPCATSSCDPAGPEGNCDTVVLADASTPCQADDSLCTIDLCDGSGECAFMGNVECPGPSGECDGGETCNPSTGLCVDNDDAAAGTPCEADDDPCTEDECDGTGNCIQGLGCVPPQVCRPAGCRPPHP
jgi:hypothetical protein